MERPHRADAAAAAWALLAAEVLTVLVLARLGRTPGFAPPAHDAGRWIRTAPTETLVAVSGRLVGLALASWLLLATLLSLARRLLPLGRAGLALDLATPPSVRRLLDRLVVAGLGASLAIGAVRPAGALTRGTGARDTRDPPVVAAVAVDVPVPRVPPTSPASATAPPPVRRSAPAAPARADPPNSVTVRPGDNLWLIAGRVVGSDRPSEIAPYWRALVAANAATLRSHDPNLIFPGERVLLPRPAPG